MTLETWYKQDVNKTVVPRQLSGRLFKDDNNANRIGVMMMDGNEEAPIDEGATCIGDVFRADGYNVTTTCTISGNRAYFDLPATAYAIEGRAVITISVFNASNEKTTVLCVSASVVRTNDGVYLDPLPVDYTQVLAMLSTLQNAIDEAQELIDSIEIATVAETENFLGIGGT